MDKWNLKDDVRKRVDELVEARFGVFGQEIERYRSEIAELKGQLTRLRGDTHIASIATELNEAKSDIRSLDYRQKDDRRRLDGTVSACNEIDIKVEQMRADVRSLKAATPKPPPLPVKEECYACSEPERRHSCDQTWLPPSPCTFYADGYHRCLEHEEGHGGYKPHRCPCGGMT